MYSIYYLGTIYPCCYLSIAGSDSPKKIVGGGGGSAGGGVAVGDKGPAPNPPLSGEAQLKYENDRLKLALAQSSANAKVTFSLLYYPKPELRVRIQDFFFS